jgi:hypothetical protein
MKRKISSGGANGAAAFILGASLVLSGCGLPRDPESTVRLIRENGSIRVGMVAGVPPDPAAERELSSAAESLGAGISRRQASGEVLLGQLERGELDLVYGKFATNSPWMRNVHIGRAPGWRIDPPPDLEVPRFAYRHGENGWIMTMERAKP